MLALRLSTEIEARLEHIAKVTGRSKHFYAIEAVETHLQGLESKYLSDQERAEVQALVDFSRVELALAGELDPDLLNLAEHDHYFEATVNKVGAHSDATKRFYAALGEKVGTVGTDELDVTVWRHADGTDKPFPPS